MCSQTSDLQIGALQNTILALVQQDGSDLTSRQLGILLISYLEGGPHTVRGLASRVGINKPAVTRALDRLCKSDLVRRKVDPDDRRSVNVQRTIKGAAFLRNLRAILSEADVAARKEMSLISPAAKIVAGE